MRGALIIDMQKAVLVVVGALIFMYAPSRACAMRVAEIEKVARLCSKRFPIEEHKSKIPPILLPAIAVTESGRWSEKLGMNVPWPWSIRVDGQKYFFDTKEEAISRAGEFIEDGKTVAIGCMMLSPDNTANLHALFDPATNMAMGANKLSKEHDKQGDWIRATAAYNPAAPNYMGEIEKNWNTIVDKVDASRESKSEEDSGKPWHMGFDQKEEEPQKKPSSSNLPLHGSSDFPLYDIRALCHESWSCEQKNQSMYDALRLYWSLIPTQEKYEIRECADRVGGRNYVTMMDCFERVDGFHRQEEYTQRMNSRFHY